MRLPCGCNPSPDVFPARCDAARLLRTKRDLTGKRAEQETDQTERRRLWLLHHEYTIALARHLSVSEEAR